MQEAIKSERISVLDVDGAEVDVDLFIREFIRELSELGEEE